MDIEFLLQFAIAVVLVETALPHYIWSNSSRSVGFIQSLKLANSFWGISGRLLLYVCGLITAFFYDPVIGAVFGMFAATWGCVNFYRAINPA
jgi:hypothetical protein